jgi:hypothetical protein
LRTQRILCAILLIFVAYSYLLFPAHAGNLRLGEDVTLFYLGARVGTSGQGSYTTWNSSITITSISQTSLVFLSNSTYEYSSTNTTVTIDYRDGIPTYADYLTALIYLPPECISQSQHGSLDWATRMNTNTNTNVTDKTSQIVNFTVPAGDFQTINITLALTGMDFGTLTFLYDLASGILIFEQWVPSYGDIITLSLTSETVTLEAGSVLLDLILPITVLTIPAAMGLDKASKKLRRRSHNYEDHHERGGTKDLHRVFFIILAGALLNSASLFLPWGKFLGIQMYLPLSLPLVFTVSTAMWTPTMLTASLAAHAAAALAWSGIALQVYTKMRLAPRLVAVSSGVLAFATASLFIWAGWTFSWGSLAIIAAGVFAITGAVAANVKSNVDAA